VYGYVLALTVYNNKLIAGGIYTTAGGMAAANIAEWDGSTWNPLATYMGSGGTVEAVYTLTVADSDLVAGGIFTYVDGVGCGNAAGYHEIATAMMPFENNGFKFGAAYPNPFSDATTIQFQLTEEENIEIVLEDVCARRIKAIASGRFMPGNYSITVDAGDLNSGNYLCRFRYDSGTAVKMLQVIK
jgi:hypothetical protein